MFHAAIVRRVAESETYLYRNNDHRAECTRRLQSQEPTARIFNLTSRTRPQNVTLELR